MPSKNIRFLRRFYDGLMGAIQILLGIYLFRGVNSTQFIVLPEWINLTITSPIYAGVFIIGGLILLFYKSPRPIIISLVALTPLLSVYLLQLYLSLTQHVVIRSSAYTILFEMTLITLVYLLFRINENTQK